MIDAVRQQSRQRVREVLADSGYCLEDNLRQVKLAGIGVFRQENQVSGGKQHALPPYEVSDRERNASADFQIFHLLADLEHASNAFIANDRWQIRPDVTHPGIYGKDGIVGSDFTQRGRNVFRVHGRALANVIHVNIQPAQRLFVFPKHCIQERAI